MSDEEKKEISKRSNIAVYGMLLTMIISIVTAVFTYGKNVNRIEQLEDRQKTIEVTLAEYIKEQSKMNVELSRGNDELRYNLRTLMKNLGYDYEDKSK